MPKAPSKLATAVAPLLAMPAVRHLLNVVATLLTGWLLLRFGGLMPAPVPAPVAPVEAPAPEPASEVAPEPEAVSAPVLPPVGD